MKYLLNWDMYNNNGEIIWKPHIKINQILIDMTDTDTLSYVRSLQSQRIIDTHEEWSGFDDIDDIDEKENENEDGVLNDMDMGAISESLQRDIGIFEPRLDNDSDHDVNNEGEYDPSL